MTLLEILFVIGALAISSIGIALAQLWSVPAGAVIALLPFALAVLGPIIDAAIRWRDRRPKPLPRAIAIRR